MNITAQGGGSVSPATGGRYSRGSVVGLTPTADDGWTFAGWSGPDGDAVVYDPQARRYKLYMDGNKNLTAIFVRFTTLISPANAGEVEVAWISGPTGGGSSRVRLTAKEAEGSRYIFDYWSGDLTGTDNPKEVVADGPLTVQANFRLLPFSVDVSTRGKGSVQKGPTSESSITLTPHAEAGWKFDHWGGDLTGTADPAQIALNRDQNVTAYFSPLSITLAPAWFHTTALVPSDGVWGWGNNASGQLANGTTTASLLPVRALDLPDGVTALSAGGNGTGHTVAVVGGRVYSWGRNNHYQLGDGTSADRWTPVLVGGLAGVSRIAAGGAHTVALAGGTVFAWGYNLFGQVGNGSTTDQPTPVGVSVPESVTAIASGGYFTLALANSGKVYAWGHNRYGQLGDGTVEARPTPQAVPGLAGIAAIYAGRNHAFALTTSGQVYSWGRNDAGQLGVDLPSSSPLATDYDSGAPVSYLSAPHQVFFPGPVATVTTIAAGQDHSLALTNDGVYSWGSNSLGQLGDSSTGFRYQPAKVSGLPANIAGIAAGGYSSFAWTPDGDVYAWGDNEFGELGNGTSQNNVSVPTLITWGPWSSP